MGHGYSQVGRYQVVGCIDQMRHRMTLRDKPDVKEHEYLTCVMRREVNDMPAELQGALDPDYLQHPGLL